MNLDEIVSEDVYWINLAQDRAQWCAVLNTAMYLRVSIKIGIFLVYLKEISAAWIYLSI